MRTPTCIVLCSWLAAGAASAIEIRTLGNRADLVSGGDALVEVLPPPGGALSGLRVTVNGVDQSAALTRRPDGSFVGVLTGLRTGDNTVAAAGRGTPTARLVITNAPRSGPVLSGAQPTPFHCATPVPRPASGAIPQTAPSGLGSIADANCGMPSEFRLFYRTTLATPPGGCPLPDPFSNSRLEQPTPAAEQCWKPYEPGSTPPDMAPAVTTDAGVTMPFVVRLERGTLNRGIYDIAVLFDPRHPWTATAPQAAWNGKVWYSFGHSTGQPRRQVRPSIHWSGLEAQLRRGWLVAHNSMSDSSRNSNRVMMSETVMMMKEHITDSYGPIRFTVGTGCSGGAINANTSQSILPGLLDGVITACTYPDAESTALEVNDCSLLVEAYQKPALLSLWKDAGLTQAQINRRKAAINGHPDQTGCQAWFNLYGQNGRPGLHAQRLVVDAASGFVANTGRVSNNCELPNHAVYDPDNSLTTAALPRCDPGSWAVSIWGRVFGTQAARGTYDNVGVQYGLGALLAGAITAEEFVVLNEIVGGFNREAAPRPARSSADPEALQIAYRAGIVVSGRELARAAIIDLRGWDDSTVDVPPQTPKRAIYGIHHQRHSWAVRERIVREEGDAGSHALWRFGRGGADPSAALRLEALDVMDEWLERRERLGGQNGERALAQMVRDARPPRARDFCYLSSDAPQGEKEFDAAACDGDRFLQPSASPRQVAGGPRTEDILKCQLKPLAASDYPEGAFGSAQLARLRAVFAAGVCDWSRPGVGQQPSLAPLTFRGGPGGQPLGPAPRSVAR